MDGSGARVPGLIQHPISGYSIRIHRARRSVPKVPARICNPSLQADPTGEFIHRWVPELSSLKGKGRWYSQLVDKTNMFVELHNPPPSAAKALGYPQPIIAHNEARQRALRRYGNPGTK